MTFIRHPSALANRAESGVAEGCFRVFDETMAEVVEGVFQHASGDIGDLGILVDQQCGGIGFAAGGEAAK